MPPRTAAWSKRAELTARWRLLDEDCARTAAAQMAADQALLAEVAAGAPAALRLYTWSPPALSVGRFQPWDDVDLGACARLGLDVVRRPTGGKAVLHGADLTYAVALPRPPGRSGTVRSVYELIAGALIDGLGRLGVEAAVARHDGPGDGPVCFASQQGADLRVGDRKLCGSAQTRIAGSVPERRTGSVPERRAGSVLQHGSILLTRLAFDETDVLVPPPGGHPGPEDLRRSTVTLEELGVTADARTVGEALVEGWRATLDVEFTPSPCSLT